MFHDVGTKKTIIFRSCVGRRCVTCDYRASCGSYLCNGSCRDTCINSSQNVDNLRRSFLVYVQKNHFAILILITHTGNLSLLKPYKTTIFPFFHFVLLIIIEIVHRPHHPHIAPTVPLFPLSPSSSPSWLAPLPVAAIRGPDPTPFPWSTSLPETIRSLVFLHCNHFSPLP